MPFDFSLIDAPFRMQPGLRRVAPGAAQLTPSRLNGRHLREKMAVLSAFADEALCATGHFEALPALCAIAEQAARECEHGAPPAFSVDDRLNARAPALGWAIRDGLPCGGGDPAIGDVLRALSVEQRCTALLCLAFEEDFAVIDGASATLPWIAVCLSSRWAPRAKVGRHFAEVHAPVADNERLLAASASLARLVTGPERWERSVWTISAEPRLHQHPARGAAAWPDVDGAVPPAADADALVTGTSFRSERQTFIPVRGKPAAVFTIHVESMPLAKAITNVDAARRVHASLASMTPAVLRYKGLDTARDRLLDWLARRAEAEPAAGP